MIILRKFTTIKLPRVFFDISVNEKEIGRLVFELRSDIAPKTTENFRVLCIGGAGSTKCGVRKTYKGSVIHRIVPGLLIQGGDYTKNNGTGGESIYNSKFNDESFILEHGEPGILSMANSGPNSNGSQFFITTIPCPKFNGKYVAFGKVVKGLDVLEIIEAQGTENGVPYSKVLICDSGEISSDDDS
ncbi:hypothetical protein SteCoe_2129 [Stentor coeruleus]|uniref:Peptidyl-prolyl cis-trans isomerase n=1 Tax=Stentor coeruleus TaxID=5963 RepID=A0A1R2D049_9CILI|nr:hypothetical protein SteCoe_2129 [Stentor coeruleus]